jgi:SPP1 gp7 family putative phage head morphogenesis protein
MNLSLLPDLWRWPAHFNPRSVTRRAWLTERWWGQQAQLEWERVATAAKEGRAVTPEWAQIADAALHAAVRLGAYGAKGECTVARKQHRSPAPAVLRKVKLAEASLTEPNWERFPGETWEEFKARVFVPLHDSMFGIPTEFCERYVAGKLPLIANTAVETQRRVQAIIDGAQRAWVQPKELEAQLQAAGNWPLARVRTQIRTETSNLYNAGRYAHMEGDEAVVGYRYVVTLDKRTSPICRALAGRYVKAEELRAVPPLHFSCRTVLSPVMEWDKGFAYQWGHNLPAPGVPPFGGNQYQGFGQPDLIRELRGL